MTIRFVVLVIALLACRSDDLSRANRSDDLSRPVKFRAHVDRSDDLSRPVKVRAFPLPLQKPAPPQAARAADAAAMFLKLFDVLDADRDGVVPLTALFDALNLQQAEARQIKRARALDGNGDGRLTRAEAVAGVHAEIAYQTNRGMNTDADADDVLTPVEYALSFPDPNGKADASGVTPMQLRGFREDDLDGDGRITRAEIETRVAHSYVSNYWARAMAFRARCADRDGDGALDERELAALDGSAQALSDEARKRFQSAGATDGRLPLQNAWLFFLRLNDAARDEAEKRLHDFEGKLKPAN
jgi:hypothetical protein